MKEGWLSEDAWREGESKLGVPARLNGREKLNEGRGRTDDSELTEGDRREEARGDAIAAGNAALPEDSLRGGSEWKDPPILLSSSVGTSGDDMILEERLGNRDLGGIKPSSSSEPGLAFSGDPVMDSC
jgi:hypothetical protein